ncbi:hypothetical protein CC1G_11163 [Coprinopsis cinerea okayama7|uniref:HD/PDEase domain-containing protein n=1 Tax=Coprinopsis cinerea (strain Okayama-7 / 130 / ATCC MYA-4618 / FGSC 9003) TaxID=240176 RepID=A8P4C1_COPC7|nr:hypothetical protein CC1G_11163 [Coprinopsis cinerea okayama7\|eukprot:XP_001838720.1 hypothetical protein CC1G_11163 [Coprinopsis cinerea okayama7\
MYPTPQEKAVIEEAEQMMVDTMARYDPSHDRYHVYRVRKTAMKLARALPAGKVDLLVVELAALLHDVLDKKYVSAEQAADPYQFFLPFFERMSTKHGVDLISDNRGKLVAKVIDNVSWSTEKRLREKGLWTEWHEGCLELHCVQDADRLDAIGAFGVLRCAAYSSVTNRPLHTGADDPNVSDTAIQHFHDKLVHIRGLLKTELAKEMGDKRHKVLTDFLAAIEDEYAED